jgi:hypothetical protein
MRRDNALDSSPLRRLELLERLRVVDQLRRRLDAAHFRARLRDAEQHVALLLREALHRLDEVRNQVSASLILIDDLRPRRLDLLVLGLKGVVAAARQLCRNDQSHQP